MCFPYHLTSLLYQPKFFNRRTACPLLPPLQPPSDPTKRARWSALHAAASRARSMLGLGEGQAAALAELFGGNGRPSLVPEGLGITPSISGLCRWGLGKLAHAQVEEPSVSALHMLSDAIAAWR